MNAKLDIVMPEGCANTENFGEYNLAIEERRLILKAFEVYRDESVKFISRKLGINERTMYRKLEHYGIREELEHVRGIAFEEIRQTTYHIPTMEKDMITRAFELYPDRTDEFIAAQLGMDVRSLYNKVLEHDLVKIKQQIKDKHQKINYVR